MIFQAHRGVSTENPENTMPAFESAVRQGYEIIELDVSVTKDLKFVLLHDDTLNRTGRDENGDSIPEPIKIFDFKASIASPTTLESGAAPSTLSVSSKSNPCAAALRTYNAREAMARAT